MPTEGTPAFNAITVLEIHGIDYRAGQPALSATAAYISTRTGKTYGQTTLKNCWSRETLILLEGLRVAMEQDMANLVFEDTGEAASPQPPVPPTGKPIRDSHGQLLGIGEELEHDVRSV
jgi:hypothetical protein